MSSSSLFCWFILFVLLIESSCRIYSNSMSLYTLRRNSGWNFLDRINLNPGKMNIQLKINIITKEYRSRAQYKLQFAIIPSQIWQKEAQVKCASNYTLEQQMKKRKHEIVFATNLNNQNYFSVDLNTTIELPNYITYQFVIRDCTQTITNEGFSRDSRLNIELEITNNGNYYSATQRIYACLLPLLILCQLTIIILLGKNWEEDSDNWFKWFLKISMSIGLVSLVMKFIGYAIYAWISGSDSQFFDFMYLFLHSTSDSIVIVLLILLSYGWIITFNSLSDFDMYIPLACMLGLINVIMTLLNKVSDGQHDKYHMFDTIPAYVMMFFRMIGFGIFLIGVIQSYSKLKLKQNQFRRYFANLTVFGTIYLISVPVYFFLIRLVDADYRKETMFFGIEFAKLCLNIWLAYLVRWKQSSYRRIIDQSFMENQGKYL